MAENETTESESTETETTGSESTSAGTTGGAQERVESLSRKSESPAADESGDSQTISERVRTASGEKFWDSFTDEALKNSPSIRKHANVEALAKSYVELSRKLGQRGDVPLPPDATPDQIEARRALRRGENVKSAEDYSWRLSADDASRFITGTDLKGIEDSLFKAGLDNETYTAAMENIAKAERAKGEQFRAAMAKSEQALRDEWNEDFDINMRANAMFVARNFPEVHDWLTKTGMYYDKNVAEMFHKLNEMTADGEIRIKHATEKSFEDRLSELTKSDAYKQTWHPDHDKAIRARTELMMEMAERRRRGA